MSTKLVKPQSLRPVAPAKGTPTKAAPAAAPTKAAPAPAIARPAATKAPPAPAGVKRPLPPPKPAAPAFDPGVSTKGISIEEANRKGLAGSQLFGAGATPTPEAVEEVTVNPPEDDLGAGWFDDEIPATQETAPAEVTDGEDYGDDMPETTEADEGLELDLAGGADLPAELGDFEMDFGEETQTETLPEAGAVHGVKQAERELAARKFKRLQDNGSHVYDSDLVADLTTVGKAKAFWDETSGIPYTSLSGFQKYTRAMAADIIIRDREARFRASRLMAQAILRDTDDIEGLTDGEMEVSMTLGKDEAQAGQSDLGQGEPTQERNPMMDKCQNRAVGCNSMKLQHLQATGRCFFPQCPCKGKCTGFVAVAGGETQAGVTKSDVPATGSDRPVAAPVAAIVRPVTGGYAAQAAAIAADIAASVAASRGPGSGAPQGQPQGARPPQPVGSVQRPSPGGTAAPAARPQQSPGVGTQGTGIQQTGAEAGGQPQADAAGSASGSGGQSIRAGSEGQRPVAETQSDEGEEPEITPERLERMMREGGRGPDHSDYWPVIPMSTDAITKQRFDYIVGRMITYWNNATHDESGALLPDVDLASNSYRVKLAADGLAEAIKRYSEARPQNDQDEQNLSRGLVGPAAKAYVEAHSDLATGQADGTWHEYLEFIEMFKDAGLKMGMFLHDFQAQQAQAQPAEQHRVS